MCRENYHLKSLDLFLLLKILRRCFLNLYATIFLVILLTFKPLLKVEFVMFGLVFMKLRELKSIHRVNKKLISIKLGHSHCFSDSLFLFCGKNFFLKNIILNFWFMSSDLNLGNVYFTSYAEFKEYIDIWFVIILILQSLSTLLPHPSSN